MKQYRRTHRKTEESLKKTGRNKLNHRTKKCQHGARILGHIAVNGEIIMIPEKIKAVMEYLRPITARKIKQFLGLTGYSRKFIKKYHKIAFPLLKILRGKRIFSSTFKILKKKNNVVQTILVAPNLSEDFIVTTDA
jgi:hypothetical protein